MSLRFEAIILRSQIRWALAAPIWMTKRHPNFYTRIIGSVSKKCNKKQTRMQNFLSANSQIGMQKEAKTNLSGKCQEFAFNVQSNNACTDRRPMNFQFNFFFFIFFISHNFFISLKKSKKNSPESMQKLLFCLKRRIENQARSLAR